MAISNNYAPIRIRGNGVTVDFSGGWNIIAAAYLIVILENRTTKAQTLQSLGDYSVAFTSASFTVTFDTAPTDAYDVLLGRSVDLAQSDPYRTAQGFQGAVIENSFDKLTAITQDLQDQVRRSPKLAFGSSGTPTIEDAVAGSSVVWNDAGTGLVNGPTVDEIEGAQDAAAAAVAAATLAQGYAETLPLNYRATSTTSNTLLSGSKTFNNLVGGDFLDVPDFVMMAPASAPTNYLHGEVTSRTATSITVNATTKIGSGGPYTDWIISLSAVKGAKGDKGDAGAGTGDMLGSNNLSDVDDAPTACVNLGLGTGDSVTHDILNLNTAEINLDADAANVGTITMESLTADRSWQMPDKSGVMATVDDIDDAISQSGLFTGTFEFTFSLSASITLSQAHGLGGTPKEVYAHLICTSADLGWSVGDIIPCPINNWGSGGGVMAFANATQVGVTTSQAIWIVKNGSPYQNTPLNFSNWTLLVRARI